MPGKQITGVEWRWLAAATCITLALSSLPYLVGAAVQGNGLIF